MCNSTWNGKFVSVIDASLLIFPSGSHVESTRIHKYASCSNECYVLALIYIDRLIQRNNFLLTNLNVHRVVITAILLAAKFFDDAYYNNAYYAKIGGVLVSEMNGLEVDFLFRINFSLHVTPEEYKKYQAELWTQSSTHTTSMTIPALPPVVPIPQPAPLYTPALQETFVDTMTHPVHRAPQLHAPPPLITPSPPPEARRVEHPSNIPPPTCMTQHPAGQVTFAANDFSSATEFRPMLRANSVPFASSTRCLPGGSSWEMYMSQIPQPPGAQRLM